MCKSTCVSVTWDLLALGVVLLVPASRSVSQESGVGVPPACALSLPEPRAPSPLLGVSVQPRARLALGPFMFQCHDWVSVEP